MLEIVSKVVSIFLNIREQLLLKSNRYPMQFGATPKGGCSEAVFSLKTLLQSRREHRIDSYAMLIDLVKAYNSIINEFI